MISDRERIARDLHDIVIQRLFATGLQLQGVAGMAGDEAVTTATELWTFVRNGGRAWRVSAIQDFLRNLGIARCDSAGSGKGLAARLQELGATVSMEPMDVEGVGRMCMLQDPQGARPSHDSPAR